MTSFNTLEELMAATATGVRPPERITISESAERFRYINNPASYVGPWDNEVAPYLIEPMNVLSSLDYTGMIFAGPARCGKSDLFFNWLGDTATRDPADMMVIHMTKDVARDWSKADLQRFFRHSKKVGETVTPGRNNMNVHDVSFLSGMRLLVKWPTVSEVSGKTMPRLWINDHDRIENSENVDGEGPLFDLAKARATTFRRHGMTVAESSPGRDVTDAKWKPASPDSHEAPPCTGILSLYNRGDMRRWKWKCPQCTGVFEPDFKLLSYPESADFRDAAEQAVMVCPHCGGIIPHKNDSEYGLPGKHEMNQSGRWIKDGQLWLPDGTIEGVGRRSDIASFWLKGPAAWAVDWSKLVYDYLIAQDAYERTGDEGPLRATINTGQGDPYTPKAFQAGRLPEDIKALAKDIGDRVVPKGVRFLVATADVQGNRFDVQVFGFGMNNSMTIIDRFAIRKSARLDDDDERKPVDPGKYPEDWDLLIEQVILKTYPLGDDSGRHMPIKMVGSDSAGRAGATTNAYSFWRRLRESNGEKFPTGLHRRFQLIKGSSLRTAPRAQITYPDSDRKDRNAGARGEIPVLFLNPELLKDQLNNMLGREPDGESDTGRTAATVTFPTWLPDWFWMEMVAETKTEKGWENLNSRRNEAWDLSYYALGLCLMKDIRWEKIDWANCPSWADEWDNNALVFNPATGGSILGAARPKRSLADLAKALA
nr:MAG: terminase large subunit [Caudoviricetes sp.]